MRGCWTANSLLLGICLASSSPKAFAAERGLNSYVPAYYGDFGVAVAPAPGLYTYVTTYNFWATSPVNGLKGRLTLKASALISGVQYVAKEKLGDATIAFGAYTSFISADLTGTLLGQSTVLSFDEHEEGQGDTSISPLALYWSSGKWHLNVYEAVFLPTGHFDRTAPLNLSRNYFSFDTVAAMTWLDPQRGLEVSAVPGLIVNTENPSTDYRTGTEFHIDGMLNAFVTPSLALGLHGYYYAQVDGDRSLDPSTDGQRSSSAAIGPAAVWIPKDLGISGKVVAKWMHDLSARNRFSGDVLSLTGALMF